MRATLTHVGKAFRFYLNVMVAVVVLCGGPISTRYLVNWRVPAPARERELLLFPITVLFIS